MLHVSHCTKKVISAVQIKLHLRILPMSPFASAERCWYGHWLKSTSTQKQFLLSFEFFSRKKQGGSLFGFCFSFLVAVVWDFVFLYFWLGGVFFPYAYDLKCYITWKLSFVFFLIFISSFQTSLCLMFVTVIKRKSP